MSDTAAGPDSATAPHALPPEIAATRPAMTYPAYRSLLARPDAAIPIGVDAGGEPAGLALVRRPDATGCAELLSVFVAADHRRRGLAGRLLAAAAEAARAAGASELRASYASDLATTAAVERLFAGAGWEPPCTVFWLANAKPDVLDVPALSPRLIARLSRQLPPHRLVPWRDTGEEQRAALRHRIESGVVTLARDVDPFAGQGAFETMNSMTLVIDDAIEGWLLTHRTAPFTIRYTTGWVLPPWDRTGAYAMLVRAAIEAQVEAMHHDERILGTWSVPVSHEEMVRFLHRRLGPRLSRLCEMREVRRALSRVADTMRNN